MNKFIQLVPVILLLTVVFLTPEAYAHSTEGVVGGFQSGFLHPIFGNDHVVAMIGVGLLGVFLGSWARWALPMIFPLVMAFAGILGIAGVELPYVEVGIALSSVVIGSLIAFGNPKMSLPTVAVVIGFFAVFHGYAHGLEMPGAAHAISYASGFVLATGLMHLVGIGIGYFEKWAYGTMLHRITGAVIGVLGLVFLFG